jgi:beta-N-acetylhexosaminidase
MGLPLIDKDVKELEQCELIPFRRVIEAGIPAVMTTHILFPKIEDSNIPATMSHKIITGLLKETLGFQGLVVSDCMEMSAIKKYYGTVEGCLQAIRAGVDLIFISHTAAVAREVSQALTSALENGLLSIEDMKKSVDKILSCKQELKMLHKPVGFDTAKARQVSYDLLRQSITPVKLPPEGFELGTNPLFIGAPAIRATNVSNEQEPLQFAEELNKTLGGRGLRVSANPDSNEINGILKEIKDASSIVLGTYNGHLYHGQLELIRELALTHNNILVIALRNPYDLRELPEGVSGIAAYEYTRNSLKAISELLEKQLVPGGVLPVQM